MFGINDNALIVSRQLAKKFSQNNSSRDWKNLTSEGSNESTRQKIITKIVCVLRNI